MKFRHFKTTPINSDTSTQISSEGFRLPSNCHYYYRFKEYSLLQEPKFNRQNYINMKLTLTFLPIFLLLSMSVARPAHRNSSNENELESRLKKTDCVKIRNLKKSVYNYLESKLANLNSSQQELLAKKLIAKLNQHIFQSQGPWTDNGEIFARMLK